MSEVTEERYQLKNGMYLENEQHSRIMYALKDLHPEYSSDFTWDELGMASLMCAVYENEIRYCPQNRSWYIWNKRWERQVDAGGWRESKGCCMEYGFAKAKGIPIKFITG